MVRMREACAIVLKAGKERNVMSRHTTVNPPIVLGEDSASPDIVIAKLDGKGQNAMKV